MQQKASVGQRASHQYFRGTGHYRWTIVMIGVLATPVLAAIWAHRWFVTQDGSIYLYNTDIILESLKSTNPFRDYYTVRWVPLPYWGAYLLLGPLMSLFSERVADHLMISIASLGLLSCILWLRHRVAGWNGMAFVVPFAMILSLNLLWLLGLYNFLLGACFYVIGLGVWWAGRDDRGSRRAVLLAGLLIAGCFCHPFTSGLTACVLIVLSLATPGRMWGRRLVWTLASVLPSVLLICSFQGLMPLSTQAHLRWSGLTELSSIRQWLIYVRGADITPLVHTGPNMFFSHNISGWSHLPAVTTWSLLGAILLSCSSLASARTGKPSAGPKFLPATSLRGWLVVSAAFIFCALFGPADLGDAQGSFLRQRFLLLGLATAVPILGVLKTPGGRARVLAGLGCTALLIACAIQIANVWGYGKTSNRLASDFIQAKPYIGTGQRVAVLIVEPDIDYEPKPLLHLANLSGIRTGNVIWNNYGPALSFFPVQFRDRANRDLFYARGIPDFDTSQITQDDLDDWQDLLSEIEDKTDVLVVWGQVTELDEINSEWFDDEPVFQNSSVRVFKHSEPGGDE